jgi:WD40 repeat protein
MRVLSGHEAPVLSVAYSPDGRTLASGDADGVVLLWDLATGSAERVWPVRGETGGAARFVSFEPTGRLLGLGMTEFAVHLRRSGNPNPVILQGRGGSCSVAFSGNGDMIAWTGYLAREVRVACLTTEYQGRLSGYQGGMLALAHSSQDALVACGGDQLDGSGVLALWKYPMDQGDFFDTMLLPRALLYPSLMQPPPYQLSPVYALRFSPNGRTLASGEKNGRVRLWDIDTREQQTVLTEHRSTVKALAFMPDGRTLVSAEENGVLIVSNVADGAEVRRFDWGIGRVRSVAIAPDGMTAAVAGSDCSVLIWDID